MTIFEKLNQYNSIIAYEHKEESINKFIFNNPSKLIYIDLSISENLKKQFINHYKVKQLPCMISFNERVYLDSQLEETLSLINLKETEHYNKLMFDLVKSSKYFIFIKGTPQVPKCKFTRQLLEIFEELNEKEFKSFDILEDEKMREKCKEFNCWSTFPQIFYNRKFLGGLDKFKEILKIKK